MQSVFDAPVGTLVVQPASGAQTLGFATGQ
jgi:hypothetical protein